MAQSQSNVDRFSFLPEEILIFIVSLLPLREAVRTSVLSKRWYKLWTYCTSIEFDETNFTGTIHDDQQLQDSGQSAGTLRQMKKVRRDIFVESVHHTLRCLQSPKISRLDVRFGYRTRYCDFVNEWISLCLRKNIEELHFDFSVGAFHRFDFDPFNEGLFCLRDSVHATGSKSLRVLSLSFCNLGSPSFHGFPALKKVSLARLGLRKEVVENLVNNCLLLETLSLVECRYLDHIKISHPRLRLRRLIVRDCQPLTKGIDLYAPCLQYFEYFGPVVFFHLYRLTSLVEAVLDFGLQRGFHSVSMKLSNLLLVDLYRAKSLTVCGYLLRTLPAEDATSFHQLRRPLPHLKNLTVVTTLDKYELIGAFSLLRSLPKLETLKITTRFSWFTADLELEPSVSPFRHLKVVEVEDFQGSTNEIKLLKFLLQNAQVLQKMVVIPHQYFMVGTGQGDRSIISGVVDELRRCGCASPHVMISYRLITF